jgi:hypothetical protein
MMPGITMTLIRKLVDLLRQSLIVETGNLQGAVVFNVRLLFLIQVPDS